MGSPHALRLSRLSRRGSAGADHGPPAGAEFDFVIAPVETDYHREVRREADYHRGVRREADSVEVIGAIAQIGGKSLTIEQRIVLPDGSMAAEAKSVMVAWDSTARTAREISPRERAALTPETPPQPAD